MIWPPPKAPSLYPTPDQDQAIHIRGFPPWLVAGNGFRWKCTNTKTAINPIVAVEGVVDGPEGQCVRILGFMTTSDCARRLGRRYGNGRWHRRGPGRGAWARPLAPAWARPLAPAWARPLAPAWARPLAPAWARPLAPVLILPPGPLCPYPPESREALWWVYRRWFGAGVPLPIVGVAMRVVGLAVGRSIEDGVAPPSDPGASSDPPQAAEAKATMRMNRVAKR